MLRSLLVRFRCIGIAVALFVVPARDAFAQLTNTVIPVVSPCPSGNVLRAAGVTARGLTREQLTTLVDGSVAREGSVWPGQDVLVSLHGGLAFDLGRVVSLTRLRLQIDADQSVDIDASADGTTWGRLTVAAAGTASGMLTRTIRLSPSPVRYLRVAAVAPARDLAMTEFQAWCTSEKADTSLLVVDAPSNAEPESALVAATTGHVNLVKLAIALLCLVGLLAARFLPTPRLVADMGLAVLALLAAFAYFDFGAYHHPEFVHSHDVFHYFVGAKYFPELGYDSLYECAAAAEADAGYGQRIALRSQRDLRTNRFVSGSAVLSHGADCVARFTKDRWQSFASDVRYFANRSTVDAWHVALRDHGFNASPTWIAIGRAVVHRLPATDRTIGHGASMFSSVLGLLDPAFLLATVGVIGWAFGFRSAAFAVIAFGCNPLSEFSWVGGGLLRQLWFVFLVSGLCFLRRGHHAKGAVALVLATALQLFPVISLVMIAANAVTEALRTGRVASAHRRFALAALLALAFAIPASAVVTGRGDAWTEFARDMKKHATTPSLNLVGLPSVLSFRPSTRAALLFDGETTDPFARIRQARVENLERVWPLRWLGVALGLYLLFRVARRRLPDTDVAALALAFVPLAVETSSYYTAWIAVLVLATTKARAHVAIVMALLAAELGVQRVVSDLDTQYAVASAVLVTAMLVLLASSSGFVRFTPVAGSPDPRQSPPPCLPERSDRG
jgi:hypothetical protein